MKVKIHSRGLTDVLKSTGVRAHLDGRGQAVAQRARATAPVESGAYRASIRSEVEEHRTRVVAHIHADVPHGLVVEANTGNLTRALE